MTVAEGISKDTIYAVSTGGGRAAIAVIRLSGPEAGAVLRSICGHEELRPRLAVRSLLRDADGLVLDDALVIWFPQPASFTGEDVAELHVHGGRAVVAAVLATLARHQHLRPAEPGEFARRAFANGKLDLIQAEALADLVAAETEQQRRQALHQLGGALSDLYDRWRRSLIDCMARLEACIDFADEEIPEEVAEGVTCDVAALREEIARHLSEPPRGRRIRDGVAVVLIGAPNAGKSTLLNALAGREVAIVDPAPGTTRDVIEAAMDIDGVPVVVADTAGLRHSEDRVEQEGVRRAMARARAADITIAVFDGADWPAVDQAVCNVLDARSLAVLSKCDLLVDWQQAAMAGHPLVPVSARTGAGLGFLRTEIARRAAALVAQTGTPAITRERHRRGVDACAEALARFDATAPIEERAEELRLAAHALGRITGRVDVEEVLDVVFRDFCIGK